MFVLLLATIAVGAGKTHLTFKLTLIHFENVSSQSQFSEFNDNAAFNCAT